MLIKEKIRRGRRCVAKGADAALKRKMVLHYLNGTESLKVVAAQYGFGHTTLRRWIDWYENDQQRLLTLGSMEADNTEVAGTSAADGSFTDNAVSGVEMKALQEELRLAKVKLACLETLIDLTRAGFRH